MKTSEISSDFRQRVGVPAGFLVGLVFSAIMIGPIGAKAHHVESIECHDNRFFDKKVFKMTNAGTYWEFEINSQAIQRALREYGMTAFNGVRFRLPQEQCEFPVNASHEPLLLLCESAEPVKVEAPDFDGRGLAEDSFMVYVQNQIVTRQSVRSWGSGTNLEVTVTFSKDLENFEQEVISFSPARCAIQEQRPPDSLAGRNQ